MTKYHDCMKHSLTCQMDPIVDNYCTGVIYPGVPRLSPPPLQCYSMGHNGRGLNMYGVLMILLGKLHVHVGGRSDRETLSPSTPFLLEDKQ